MKNIFRVFFLNLFCETKVTQTVKIEQKVMRFQIQHFEK
jgi:hypothetical protein